MAGMIDKETTVAEIMQLYPELTDLLMEMGLCGCGHDSSLRWTMARLAREKGLPLEALLAKLEAAIS